MEKAAHHERLFFGNRKANENKVKQWKSNGFLFALDDRFEMKAIGLKVWLFFQKWFIQKRLLHKRRFLIRNIFEGFGAENKCLLPQILGPNIVPASFSILKLRLPQHNDKGTTMRAC